MIVAEHSTESLSSDDPAVAVRWYRHFDQPVLEPLVIPLSMVVRHELRYRSPEMALTEWHDLV
jgi:hypothetical protein